MLLGYPKLKYALRPGATVIARIGQPGARTTLTWISRAWESTRPTPG